MMMTDYIVQNLLFFYRIHVIGKTDFTTVDLIVCSSGLSFTSPVTNFTYSIHTHHTSSSNLIYLLTCTLCDSFFVDETKISLFARMNSHCSSSNNPYNLFPLVAIYTKSHQLPLTPVGINTSSTNLQY